MAPDIDPAENARWVMSHFDVLPKPLRDAINELGPEAPEEVNEALYNPKDRWAVAQALRAVGVRDVEKYV